MCGASWRNERDQWFSQILNIRTKLAGLLAECGYNEAVAHCRRTSHDAPSADDEPGRTLIVAPVDQAYPIADAVTVCPPRALPMPQ